MNPYHYPWVNAMRLYTYTSLSNDVFMLCYRCNVQSINWQMHLGVVTLSILECHGVYLNVQITRRFLEIQMIDGIFCMLFVLTQNRSLTWKCPGMPCWGYAQDIHGPFCLDRYLSDEGPQNHCVVFQEKAHFSILCQCHPNKNHPEGSSNPLTISVFYIEF